MRLLRSSNQSGSRGRLSLRVPVVVIVGVLALAMNFVASAAGSASTAKHLSPSATKPVMGGTATVDIIGGTWPTLDPSMPTSQTSEFPYFASIYGTLFDVNSSGQLVPDLATQYAISPDGKTVTIDLRPKVTFSDGTPFTSAAVKWNLTRDALASTNCLCTPFLQAVRAVTTPNKTTVVIHLKNRYSPLMGVLTTSPGAFFVSPSAYQSEGVGFQTAPIGAGPYKVSSDVPNSTLTLVKNSRYWDAKHVYLNQLNLVVVGTGASAVAAVASHTAQLATGLAPADVTTAKGLGVPIVSTPALGYYMFQMNQYLAPFNNPIAREALQYATNPAAISAAVLLGTAKTTEVMTGPAQTPFYGYKLKGAITYDPAKAKALVQQLGGLSFSFFTIANSGIWPQMAQALVQQWAAVGINATAQVIPHNVAVTYMTNGTGQAELDTYGIYLDPLLSMQTIAQCGATINHTYCDHAVDHLMLKVAASNNPTSQLNYYGQMWKQMLITDHGYVPLTVAPVFDAFGTTTHITTPIGGFIYYKNFWLS